MRVVFYTNNVSPHQLPVAREVMRRVGRENFLYVGEEIAWNGRTIDAGEVQTCTADSPRAREWLENAEVMYTGGLRPIDLLELRTKRGLASLYCSERWFKPVPLFDLRLFGRMISAMAPGWVRLLVPGYRRMAKRFVSLANENACVRFLPIGPWARRDFLRLGVRSDKLVDWGYFVERGRGKGEEGRGSDESTILKVLWVGRVLGLKRVDTIIRAVKSVGGMSCTIVGDGPELPWLRRLAQGYDAIRFLPSQPNVRARELMRGHDLYVFASDAQEGWGAVVSEALEEGMSVLGTFESGASAAMLPRERLFRAGDWKALAELLRRERRGELPRCGIGDWTATKAAERLLACVAAEDEGGLR